MSWWEAILWLGALIGAVSAIVVAVRKALKPFTETKQQIIQTAEDVKQTKEEVKKLREHDEDQYMALLRLTLMSPEIPISERIIAGDKYLKAGGNGDCKHYYFDLLKEHTK